ncbi:hypothetical protein WMY93_015134 [Mugilogobius chulae]|uniref:Uncharacterized protein n=1 Tax=Mugilogobius chulae TaxID=88201 RepID=A0AAW0P3B2_9GOBI
MRRIRRLAFSLSNRLQDTTVLSQPRPMILYSKEPVPPRFSDQIHVVSAEEPLYIQLPQAPQERPSQIQVETAMPSGSTTERLSPLPGLWSRDDLNALVHEVVSRISPKKWDPDMIPVSQDLLAQLEERALNWNVLVKPTKHSYEDVASAVYKDLQDQLRQDLSKKKKEAYLKHAARGQNGFSARVVDFIHENLMVPPKKRSALGSFLLPMRNAFYWTPSKHLTSDP